MGGGGSFSIQTSIAWIHFLREFSFTSEYLVVKQHLVDIHISFRIKHRSDKEMDAFFRRPIHLSCSSKMPVQKYSAEERGQRETGSYKVILSKRKYLFSMSLQVFLKDASGPISPFHDIPYKASDSTFHVVIEIPRCAVVFFCVTPFCQVDKCKNGSRH